MHMLPASRTAFRRRSPAQLRLPAAGAVALVAALLGGCLGHAPGGGAAEAPATRLESDDQDALLGIARAVPGFAGFELVGDQLRLHLVDPQRAAEAEAEVRGLLRAWQPGAEVVEVEVVPARFDYGTLKEFRDRLPGSGVYALEGVVAAGIDTRANRIVVEVAAESVRTRVERVLRRAGIPQEVVAITVTGPVVF